MIGAPKVFFLLYVLAVEYLYGYKFYSFIIYVYIIFTNKLNRNNDISVLIWILNIIIYFPSVFVGN